MIGILTCIYHRLDHLFRRLGYVKDDDEAEEDVVQEDIPLLFKPRAPEAYRAWVHAVTVCPRQLRYHELFYKDFCHET